MNRRQFLGSAAAPALAQTAGGSPRNVLLLIADDHSPIAGCYGNKVVRTPNLDRLAREGTLFRHAFCTTPSCAASRSVVLTGLQNHANGQFGHAHMPHDFTTHRTVESLPKLLRARGVATGVIGKLHVEPPEVYPWDFQSAGGKDGGTRDVWGMAEEARRFWREIGDKPFYLQVGFADPHRSHGGKQFANNRDYPKVERREYRPADVIVPDFLPDSPAVRAELAEYYQAIDRLDQGIGFFLEALEQSGRARDTLVIYMSDHGMPFPGAKGSPYDSGLHCPLIVRSPEQRQKGVSSDALVHWPDITPTVLDWTGAAGPSYPLHGKSLLPVLESATNTGRDEIYFSHTFHEINNYFPVRGIRTHKYKYSRILYPELEMPLPSDLYASPTWEDVVARRDPKMGRRRTSAVLHHTAEELYDVERDPAETTNLAGRPAMAETLATLREKVRAFRRETRDPWFKEAQGLT
ncbi:MAG: sulfatase [Bryobacterales bacterium]|nr:sulfatase [Bryobacterales bacterium]